MKTASILLTTTLLVSSAAFAHDGHFVVGAGISHPHSKTDALGKKFRTSSDTVNISAGYDMPLNDKFAITPFVTVGKGFTQRDIYYHRYRHQRHASRIAFEQGYFVNTGVEAKYNLNENLFVAAMLAHEWGKTTNHIHHYYWDDETQNHDQSGNSYGLGVGYNFTPHVSIGMHYSRDFHDPNSDTVGFSTAYTF